MSDSSSSDSSSSSRMLAERQGTRLLSEGRAERRAGVQSLDHPPEEGWPRWSRR